MRKNEGPLYLTASEFLACDRSGLNQQIANARWQFLLALKRRVPEFFERLRDDTFPTFARLVKPDYWSTGRSFSMWQSHSDPDLQFTPVLMKWASQFHVEEEEWILEGALQTLSNWNKFPHLMETLDIQGFRESVCVSGLISYDEHFFSFSNGGWDPTLTSFAGFRHTVRKEFDNKLRQYERQMRAIVRERGGVRAAGRFSADHFDWLALYQCANASLESIADGANYGDKTTISKGMHQAAKLACISIRAKGEKLKSRQSAVFQLT